MLRDIAGFAVSQTPGLRHAYHHRRFLRDWGTGFAYWGVYDSFEAARRDIPARCREGFNHADQSDKYEEEIFPPKVVDYPVIFWLSRILRPQARVFDLGGSIGVTYYVCKRHIEFPEGLNWQVCDVPEVVKAGQVRAAAQNNPHLSFTSDRDRADGCDIYLTGGTLQYLEEPFTVLLGHLKNLPRHLFVNKVPFTEGKPFITLQNVGGSICPYKIANREQFIRSLEEIGYDLADFWEINRTCNIPLHPERFVRAFHGMYFKHSGCR